MKVTSDDPVLTAYVLGELDPVEKEAMARCLEGDENLREEASAISSLAVLLSGALGREALSLGEDRIAEIHKAGRRPDSRILVMEHRKRARRQSLMAVAGVAAMVVMGFVVLSRFDTGGDPVVADGEVAGAGSSGAGDLVPGDSSDLPSGFVPSKVGVVGLPMRGHQADPAMVERAIDETGGLPERDWYLVADWIHLVRRDSGPMVKVGNLGVSYELGPCSWNPSAALLMIHLEPLEVGVVELRADLEFFPARVGEVRLTGGAGEEIDLPASLSELKKPRTFLYELDLLEGTGELGFLALNVGGVESLKVPLGVTVLEKDEVSTSYETARILGEYARWGASQGRDRETLVRLVREAKLLLGKVVDESTRYALDMILISEEALATD